MSKIRLGFIGVGGMGQAAHLQNYLLVPDCQVVAIAEIRPKLAQAVAQRYGIPKIYNGHQELLKNEQVDALVAIQAFGIHAELVPELLEKRVPVITEKPLADTLEGGQAIVNAVKKTGTPLYLAYHKRSDPATACALNQMKAWQASGEVGKLRYIRAAMPPGDWVANGFSMNVGTDEKYDAKWGMSTPYGGFVNYYIHQVNLIRLLLGEDYTVTYADPGKVLLAGRSDSGVTVALEMQAYRTTIDWHEEVLIAFEKGFIKLELPAPLAKNRPGKVTVFRDVGGEGQTPTTTIPTLPWVHAMWQQARNFIDAVRGKPTVLATAETGLKDLQLAKAYVELLQMAK